MGFEHIIKSVIEKFESEEKNKILFLSVPEVFMKTLHEFMPNAKFIDLVNNYQPVKPFMEIISESSPKVDFIKKVAYSLHVDSFIDYFENGVVTSREDVVIPEEICYEVSRLRDTIVKMICDLTKSTYVIANAQLMGEESIKILRKLENKNLKRKFIFCFNSLKVDENTTDSFKCFYQELIDTSRQNYYNISDFSDSFKHSEQVSCVYTPTFSELLNSLKNCRQFFSLEQGYVLTKWIVDNMECLSMNYTQKRALYVEMGLICFYAGHTDEASFYFNCVLESGLDDEIELQAMFFLSQVLYDRNACSTALKYATLLEQKLSDDKDSAFYALACMQNYIINERMETAFVSVDECIEKYQSTIDLLEKRGLVNNAYFVSLIIPWNLVSNPKTKDFIKQKIEGAKEITEKLGNKFGLSTACHWKGIVYSQNGFPEEALKWYNLCNELRTEIGQLASVMKIRNGLSYELLIRAKYKESYDLINSFIAKLIDIDDYPEVIITLNNMARALFYTRQFESASVLLQKIMHFLHIFNLEESSANSFLPEYNDILMYKTVIDYDREDFLRAKINLHNILNNGRSVTTVESSLKYLIQACVLIRDGKLFESEKSMIEMEEFFYTVGKTQEHRLVFMFYEYAVALFKARTLDSIDILKNADCNSQKEFEELCLKLSKKYMEKGLKIAKEKGFEFFLQWGEPVSVEKYLENVPKFPHAKVDLVKLEERAEKERLINQLHGRLRDSQFLNRIMSFNSENSNQVTYTKNVAQSIFDYTMADCIFIAERSGVEWNVISQVSRNDYENFPNEKWEELLQISREQEHPRLFFLKEQGIIFGNLSKFEFEGGIIIIPGKNTPFTGEDFNVLNMAVMSIQAQLVMLKQNEHLLYISSTDQLSMLKNRRALQEHLSLESEMIRRYERKRNLYMHEAISFIDLDNFKYYNDTFGHEAGDLLISCFARLLKSVYRKVDFVSRFGGDEFVVVLPNTTCLEARHAAERLQKALEKARHFIPDLETLLDKKIIIKPKYLLGFSMGICSNSDTDDMTDMETAMINADHALYYSKQHNKGGVSIWSEIKEYLSEEDTKRVRLLDEK